MYTPLTTYPPLTAHSWCLTIGPVTDFQGLGRLRHKVGALLHASDLAPDLVFDAELLLTELVSNAVKYGSTARVVTRFHTHSLHVDVWDDSRQVPRPMDPTNSEQRESGRGLDMVQALASRWGFELPHLHGKRVWFDLDIPPATASCE